MIRGVGLRSATAINVATMVGAGPFITLPLVVAALQGSVSAVAWGAGALIALCDGLVWAELSARFPHSGGTYAYLREAFGPKRVGRLLAFLFVWQFLFYAPLILASGYIGFAQYAAYLWPPLGGWIPTHALAVGVGLVTLAALYRAIPQIAHTSLVLGAIALVTLLAVAAAGLAHPHVPVMTAFHATLSTHVALPALGAALVITLYDYAGYAEVCAIGEEVIAPARTMPRAVVLSVVLVGLAYLLLNLGAVAALGAKGIAASTNVASLIAERTFGAPFAIAVTVAVLVTAFASTYGNLLGASRIPFAAAREGDFLPSFARLHPKHAFPSVSLVAIGVLALPASLFSLDAVISALTAGIVLIQGVAQVVALAVVRARTPSAPFSVPLYPLPPLIALAGWIVLFASTGPQAIAFGIITLAAGLVVYLWHARRAKAWPFAATVVTIAAVLFTTGVRPAAAQTPPSFGHAIIAQRDGAPRLLVDGKPFFFWGGAFFYERLPPSRWKASMLAMKRLGANTLDLYVPWNWHELADGDFDFDGHTDPRRNLREVLRLGKELGFHFIVRPGPVIRNEWRNGGYPAWLLERPEYDMPLHDVLEGRYPATATLQNAHSDDAAAEWLNNPAHLRYASRWLHRALDEFRPYADLVLAVQLDDDQGAYINNQTYPAPHFQQYLRWLDAQVRDVIGPLTPTFINTYDMRVPAAAPVWTMGNWYQSDAYSVGNHDRVELDLTTLLLATNSRGPVAQSEFQAGWLAGAEDPVPRPADPRNTALALRELLALGAQGIIDFPMQDTYAEPGWEAPFSNAYYNWDAAIPYDPSVLPPAFGGRFGATAEFGALVARLGPVLTAAHRVADVAIAYTEPAPNADSSPPAGTDAIVARVRSALGECIDRGDTCDIIDLRYPPEHRRYATVVAFPEVRAASADAVHRLQLAWPATRFVNDLPAAAGSHVTTLTGPNGTILLAANWTASPVRAVMNGHAVTVAPHGSAVMVRDVSRPSWITDLAGSGDTERVARRPASAHDACSISPSGTATAGFVDRAEGPVRRALVLRNDVLELELDPDAGGRAFTLLSCSGGKATNAFDATGAFRDDVSDPPSPSPRDYIAKYTHDYPAGTFNRAYDADVIDSGTQARVRLRYTMPDAAPAGLTFERIVTLAPRSSRIVVDEHLVLPAGGGPGDAQRAIVRSSLPPLFPTPPATGPALEDGAAWNVRDGCVFAVAWRPADVEHVTWTPYRSTGTLALTLAPGWRRTVYAFAPISSAADARRFVDGERAWVAAHPADEK